MLIYADESNNILLLFRLSIQVWTLKINLAVQQYPISNHKIAISGGFVIFPNNTNQFNMGNYFHLK